MTDWPKLYPGHRHQWEPALDLPGTMLRCKVCEFTVPHTVANLDGQPANPDHEHDWYPDHDSDRPAGWYCRNCDAYTYPSADARPAAQPTDQPEQESP